MVHLYNGGVSHAPHWDDHGATAAVSVTFDNLGEAAEIERGSWPDDQPRGEHFSVVELLPKVLEMLERHGLAATFFVEGLNAEIYPDALLEMKSAGHELALHAWSHEQWRDLGAERERELLGRARRAMDALSAGVSGFRPPGGLLTDATPDLLVENGFRYCSPAGDRAGIAGGLAVLPFRWRLIDAYFYLPHFSALRERHGDPGEPMQPAALRDALPDALDEHAAAGGHLALIFHPFLLSIGDEAMEALDAVLAHVSELSRRGSLRYLRMDEAATWMLDHPEWFGESPQLDTASWA
jgi:peptidoglycan/xylan/chitin deacetylase (PgdA/CDA1 family)